ncbi:Uncharacterized protein EJ110_NYTH38828 [Nymphaea thermarum]|nr:Uncharacterized protein EJ110_NYTH38828 [Nymphaea thermarum]
MGSRWRKAKLALSSHLCAYAPRTQEDAPAASSSAAEPVEPTRRSDSRASSDLEFRPSTPTPSSSGLRLSKFGSRSSKRFCAICLGSMKPGHGHALFTAECSHVFHFHCIASNVKHGNQVCPVCRSKWKEIPFQGPAAEVAHGRSRINPLDWPRDDGWMTLVHRIPPPRARLDSGRQFNAVFHAPEPTAYNDDEPLDSSLSELLIRDHLENIESVAKTVEMNTFVELPAVSASDCRESFSVLIHLKAPASNSRQSQQNQGSAFQSHHDRAPVDLVTVLDVSGSMAGTKLALLKRAMGFVIQNLGPSDRLSVVAFSSTARRLFHLRRMSDSGRQQALQAVNALVSSGGTNIAEGLRKGAKVLEDRRERNPVCSIVLLSDGQDTYSVSAGANQNRQMQTFDYQTFLPFSIRRNTQQGQAQIPVHTFGFGTDHDAASMHSISETSGGTFSFIEAESVIQDAFAQCIGGLLSVVVQELQVWFECASPGVSINSVHAGSYTSRVSDHGRRGLVDVGDLYAEEERDFLVDVRIPASSISILSHPEVVVLKVGCVYKDPVLQELVNVDMDGVVIQRPGNLSPQQTVVCVEVDRQKNRLKAAEAMAEARALAEQGDLAGAVALLGNQRRALSQSVAAQAGDGLSLALDAELKEMQERMASRQVYESSGRAYVLSGLSSHSWQRATARGDSTDSASVVYGYQTPSMVDMLMRSQTLSTASSQQNLPSRPQIKQSRSFTGPLLPR